MRAFHQKINGVISAVGPSQVTRSGRKVRLTTAAAVIVAMVPASIRVRCREMRAFPTTGPARQSRQSDSAIVSPIEPKTSRIALGAVLGLIGPFGTFEALPILPRLGYWLAIAALNWLLCDIAIRRVDDVLPEDIAVRRILVPLVGAVLVSLPATGVVALAGGVSGIGSPDSILSLYATADAPTTRLRQRSISIPNARFRWPPTATCRSAATSIQRSAASTRH
jgi:hypothetical protein